MLDRLRSGELDGFGGAVRERIFTELGNGALDVAGVVAALDRIGYTGWLMVEQDSTWLRPAEAAAVGIRVLRHAIRERRPMRVAVIGAGSMGGKHAQLLAGMPDVDEVLVVDAVSERAAQVARDVGGRPLDHDAALDAGRGGRDRHPGPSPRGVGRRRDRARHPGAVREAADR